METDHRPHFVRAARAWLDLNQKDAAQRMAISDRTLIEAEKGRDTSDKTWAAMMDFYAAQGIHMRGAGPTVLVITG